MYNFDSLTLKYFFEENKDFILGSIVQKIQLPTRYEIILNLRNLKSSKNKKLYININPKYPHICFIDEKTSEKRNLEIPIMPPMFCMQLRKYINGSKIKDFKLVQYERILELYFDYFDEIGSLTNLCLSLEFMGKHSNIILYNTQNKVIVGSIHNISADKSSIREIYGGINYIYPPQQQKLDILNTSYNTFFEIAKEKDVKKIADNFYYFNQALLKNIFEKYSDLAQIHQFLQELQKGFHKDFICSFWFKEAKSVNESIDSYFSDIMFFELMENKKAALKKHLLKDIKKLEKTLSFKLDKEKMESYKLFADLIMANIYSDYKTRNKIELNGIKIKLDETMNLKDNAQKYYKLYKKAKNALLFDEARKKEAKDTLGYFEEIIFNIENSKNFIELNEIKQELIEINLIKNNIKSSPQDNKKKKQKEELSLNKFDFKGYEIYLGKNNKQNDYLISHIATGDDLWFHVFNCPSSHVILKVKKDKQTPTEVIEFCAKLTKENSKAKLSGKTSIIFTKRKNLKKPPNTHLGYVTYKNEKEIVI